MDFFRTPGANLDGVDKARFEEIQELVNNSTNEFLVRPDWNSNITCSDKIILIDNQRILAEIIFLFRRKFTNRNPQIIVLALHLLSTLVNNCGHKFHLLLLNDEKFLKDLSNLARTYNQKLGSDNKQVCDVALDLIQSWGEAFLTKRNQFNAIVELYFLLRKEGLPFKSRQFDPSRVPIVLPAKGKPSQTMYHDDFSYEEDQDAELAAAIQCSLAMNNNSTTVSSTHNTSMNKNPMNSSSTITNKPSVTNVNKSKEEHELEEAVNSLTTPMSVLIELILASNHQREIQNNEIAQDVITQLQLFQAKMNTLIDNALLLDPKELEKLFALNEDAYNLTTIYRKIRDGHLSLGDGKLQVRSIQKEQEKKNNLDIDRKEKNNKALSLQNNTNNILLDLNNNDTEKIKIENEMTNIKPSSTTVIVTGASTSSVIFDPFAPESSTALDSLVTTTQQQQQQQQRMHVPIAVKLLNPLVPSPSMMINQPQQQQPLVGNIGGGGGVYPLPVNNTTYVYPYQQQPLQQQPYQQQPLQQQPYQQQPQQQPYQPYQTSPDPFQQQPSQSLVLQPQQSSYTTTILTTNTPYNNTILQPVPNNNYPPIQATASYPDNNFIKPTTSATNTAANPLDLFNTSTPASIVPISNTSNTNIGTTVNASASKANPFDLLDS